ncbi:citrate lyase subunit beta/citryl-CoA lyase [Arthrobacter sp. GAS37]|uniref:HpcH/HpaI aldolase/citrate lyase family protein n=1 Tax=Arthrobacter sp. GAS37 TaxID=3156261 RepID=UPI003835E21A
MAAARPCEIVSEAVTMLFVPGDRPERFGKAAATEADVIVVDLEDAVAPEAKAPALDAALTALASGTQQSFRAIVRINVPGSPNHEAEIAALTRLSLRSGHGLLGIMLPKAESVREVQKLRQHLPEELALVPLIESAAGLVNSLEIARVPGVTRLGFGAIDFALDMNTSDTGLLAQARFQLVLSSRAANIAPPLDSPSTEIRDLTPVAESARTARKLGFGGMLCIHPRQVPVTQRAFMPDAAEILWAQSVTGVKGGAAQLDGQMIDRPVQERAAKILQSAKQKQ